MWTLKDLPPVRGTYYEDRSLAPLTWFKVGGPARVLYKPADQEDLACFIKERPREIPLLIIGMGSNLLVRDGGFEGIVIRLGKEFSSLFFEGHRLLFGAGALDRTVALACRDEGFGGLEFLYTIPGSLGGALRMNAGCYGTEIKDVLEYAHLLDDQGKFHRLSCADLSYSYRHCGIPKEWIFLGGAFKGYSTSSVSIDEILQKYVSQRDQTQPTKTRTGGSTFANPPGDHAWRLIDGIGYRGKTLGGAQVSEKHCNFLINQGTATAYDLEQLGEDIRQKVLEKYQVDLRWEIERVGSLLPAIAKESAA